jgi:MerR family transcriptional regulator/heat shock protein HspR
MFPLFYSFSSRDVTDADLSTEEGDFVERASDGSGKERGARRTGAQSGASSGGNKRGQRGTGLAQIAADRPIFTLSVAADLLGLHPRTLRIYEEKGLVIPSRTEGNRRRYSQNDIQRFQFIRQLTRSGVNLEGVRIILDMADELTRLGGNPAAVIERSAQAQTSDEA